MRNHKNKYAILKINAQSKQYMHSQKNRFALKFLNAQ